MPACTRRRPHWSGPHAHCPKRSPRWVWRPAGSYWTWPPHAHPGPGGRLSGIDYLGILAERHRQHIHHQLRVVDPTGALAGLRGWPLINVLSRGRLLTCGPAG